MNFLAHLLLAEDLPESFVGNLAADFLNGEALESFTPGVAAGIRQHRAVDAFTDQHEIVKRSIRRLAPTQRHFSGIVVDVVYDHFLTCHWDLFCNEPFDAFVARAYNTLRHEEASAPAKLREALPRMFEQDWLRSYRTLEGLSLAFQRISRRLSRPGRLAEATEDLRQHYAELDGEFLAFFPELRAAFPAKPGTPPPPARL